MQPDIPYRVIGKLGACDVGTVWSATEHAWGGPLTVAVLDARVAADQRWRDAFAGHASAIAGRPPGYAGADFNAATPWVAFHSTEEPGAERVFISLGRPYTPDAPPPDAEPPTQLLGMPDDTASRRPYFGEGAEDPYAAPTAGRKRGNGLWAGIAAAVVILVVGGVLLLTIL